MTEGLSNDLLLAAVVVFAAGVLILGRRLGPLPAAVAVFLKVAFVLTYFSFLDKGAIRLLDDVTYATEASDLLASSGDPVAVLSDPSNNSALFAVAGGRHVGYYVFNVLAQYLFGEHYYSAVFLNVLLTCVAAAGVYRILRGLEFSRGYSRGAVLFFLLHWDVIAWSSFLNLKDTLVMTLTTWLFTHGLALVKKPRASTLLLFLVVTFLCLYVRSYVPILVLATFGSWGVLALRGTQRMILIVAGLAFLGLWSALSFALPLDRFAPTDVPAGALRYLFTPRPWGIEENYRFLLVPSLLHWIFMPFLVLGGIGLWFQFPRARVLVLYLLVLTAFYSAVPHLQGPRHRFQLAFILAILQFYGMYRAAARLFLVRPVQRFGAPLGLVPRTPGVEGSPSP